MTPAETALINLFNESIHMRAELARLRAQVAGQVREYDRGFTAASTVCDIEIQHLRGLLREALDELEVFNPAGVSLQHKIRREIGGEKP
jgi:hypothetical protein